jgi:putative Mn2+ efflux pump MntP
MIGLLLLALALAMDAFAAALGQGAAARPKPTPFAALRVGLAFGGAQAVMPLLGWSLGLAFESVIRDVDHWIAFVLLTFLGGRMVSAGVVEEADATGPTAVYTGWALTAAAIATSIDAAVAGITIPLLDQPIAVACAVIGSIAGLLSIAGVLLGGVCGVLIGPRAEMAGGLVLIGLGCKILIEHLCFDAG